MKRTLRTAVAAALWLSAPVYASADNSDFEYTNYTFGDELVHGDLVAPLGEILQTRARAGRESLVRARSNFVPELLKSIEQL